MLLIVLVAVLADLDRGGKHVVSGGQGWLQVKLGRNILEGAEEEVSGEGGVKCESSKTS